MPAFSWKTHWSRCQRQLQGELKLLQCGKKLEEPFQRKKGSKHPVRNSLGNSNQVQTGGQEQGSKQRRERESRRISDPLVHTSEYPNPGTFNICR